MIAPQTIFLLLSAIAGVIAVPADSGPAIEIVTDGAFSYTGIPTNTFLARGLERRCGENWPAHSDCIIGQCQCASGLGCYSCNGGRTQCQPGPGSGQCYTT